MRWTYGTKGAGRNGYACISCHDINIASTPTALLSRVWEERLAACCSTVLQTGASLECTMLQIPGERLIGVLTTRSWSANPYDYDGLLEYSACMHGDMQRVRKASGSSVDGKRRFS